MFSRLFIFIFISSIDHIYTRNEWEQFVHKDLRSICTDYEDDGISPKEDNRMDIDAAVNELMLDNPDELHISMVIFGPIFQTFHKASDDLFPTVSKNYDIRSSSEASTTINFMKLNSWIKAAQFVLMNETSDLILIHRPSNNDYIHLFQVLSESFFSQNYSTFDDTFRFRGAHRGQPKKECLDSFNKVDLQSFKWACVENLSIEAWGSDSYKSSIQYEITLKTSNKKVRSYLVKTYDRFRLGETISKVDIKWGKLSAMMLQKKGKKYTGIYFTTTGLACKFEKSTKDPYKYFEIFWPYEPPCWSAKVFLGCPQPFCYTNSISASYTSNGSVIIMRGPYYWELPYNKGLPLKTPKIKDAKVFNVRIRRNHNDTKKEIHKIMPTAAATIKIDSVEVIIVAADSSLLIGPLFVVSIDGNWEYEMIYNSGLFIEWPEFDTIEAMWYHSLKKKLYLFYGSGYSVYDVKLNGSWIMTELDGEQTRNMSTFGGFPNHLDAAIEMPDAGYFLKDNFYFEYPEYLSEYDLLNWYPLPRLTFGDEKGRFPLFNIKKDCNLTDDKMDKLIKSNKFFKPSQILRPYRRPKLRVKPSTKPDFIDLKDEITQRYLFIIFGSIITTICIIWCQRSQQQSYTKMHGEARHESKSDSLSK